MVVVGISEVEFLSGAELGITMSRVKRHIFEIRTPHIPRAHAPWGQFHHFILIRQYTSLVFKGFLFSPSGLSVVSTGTRGSRRGGGGEHVARGVGRVSEERGKDDDERLVVIRSEQQEKNDGEGKEAAALQTELGIDRLDGGLEGKSEMFEGAVGDERRFQ